MPCTIANCPKLCSAGASRSQLPAARPKREAKPCVPFRAASTSVAWATASPDAIEVLSSTSTSLADVAEELLRRERERQQHGSSPSSSAERLQEQLALQLDRALLARDGIRNPTLAFPGSQQVFILLNLHAVYLLPLSYGCYTTARAGTLPCPVQWHFGAKSSVLTHHWSAHHCLGSALPDIQLLFRRKQRSRMGSRGCRGAAHGTRGRRCPRQRARRSAARRSGAGARAKACAQLWSPS